MSDKPTITKHSTLIEMKAFVRKHKLNHPSIKLGLKKAQMLDALDKLGHINTDPRPKKEAPKKEAPKPKFKIDKSKQPKTTPSQIKMSYKPPLNTKNIEPKKSSQGRKNVDTLFNLDMDVSNKIGEAVEFRKFLNSLTRDQVATTYRKIYKQRNPGYKMTIRRGRSKELLINDLLELNPTKDEIGAKPNKTAGRGNKVYLVIKNGFTSAYTYLKNNGWKIDKTYDDYFSGRWYKYLTKQEGFNELKKLKDDIFGFGSEYAMYYETKNRKMMYANEID